MGNVVKLETHGGVTVFDIEGDITVASEPFLNEAYKSANTNGARKLLLKFANDLYINSGGIAILIQVLAQTRKNGQQVCITGLSEHFKKIFNMVGITKFAKIYNSMNEALQAMEGT